ncbi:unnamed protein product [Rhizoctonia solani]|uniref:mitogen-activated protein kinase kinase kinase n=1 Tax=Rhizoctonia solani TaxID=456999 RepID=A0A8H3BBU0_9AGAM|nr:unnamed protein product [Rhizoctonia solani]
MDQVIAMFDFNATDQGELSFKKGEILTVLDRKYNQWWLCKNENNMHGVVPRNHIKSSSRLGPRSTLADTKTEIDRESTPISRKMTAREVVSQLVAHGCHDLTARLNLTSFAEYPVSHGGFSDIYRGQLLNGTSVAVKALRVSVDSISQNPKHLKHAARELHTWGRCAHPNVIQLFGLAIFRGRIGMVSPWMTYGILPRYLERVPGADRLNMCVQICEGLSYLHRTRIVHCDLKGANILVSDEGIPVLTDFGNSSLVDRTLGFTQTTSGPSFTIRWSAAEIIEETTSHTKASDVYALGMTIYETVTGMVPYQGKSESNVIRLVTVKKELPERTKVILNDAGTVDKLWKLLTECWSFEPTERPSAAKVTEVMKAIAPNTQTTTILQPTPINGQNHRAEEEHLSMKHAQEKEGEWLKKLEEEEEAAKWRATEANQLAQATRQEALAFPPVPNPEIFLVSNPAASLEAASTEGEPELVHKQEERSSDVEELRGVLHVKVEERGKHAHSHISAAAATKKWYSNIFRDKAERESIQRQAITDPKAQDQPGVKSEVAVDQEAGAHLHANPLPRPPKESTQRISATSENSAEEPASTSAIDAARRAWANNLWSEWDRRGVYEDHTHRYLHPETRPAQRTPPFPYRYRPASAEEIRYHEHQEEIKYRERQAARAAREAQEAGAARKAFEEERKRLEEERRKREEERRKNEEQVVVASWQRYERKWQDLLNGVFPEGRQLTFYDIPWPVSMPARSFEELQSSAIEKFLLSPYHSTIKTREMRLRSALMQWRPGKFAERFVDRIEGSHRTAILVAVHSVAHTITELMNEETDS